MAELLARQDRRDVDFHHRRRDGGHRIAQRHRRVGISSGIEHHAVVTAFAAMQRIDQLALDVRLETVQSDVGENRSQPRGIAKGSGTSIQEVNKLIKQFDETRKMMRMLTSAKSGKMKLPSMKPSFRR